MAAVEKIFSGILREREYLLPRIDGEYESCESKLSEDKDKIYGKLAL